ncbi:HEPN domain-containing protein [Marinicellulosiphila megalodicopiae]|uniref:HEPN domain-containing protein n=1 Tax=Marinicellulosiphila megalodicopiae TaxID=2724896 RepID=UPI003BAE8CBC
MKTSSNSKIAFDESIKDSEKLMSIFDSLKDKEDDNQIEVLKRSSLVMALTSFETYVEDRIREYLYDNSKLLEGSTIFKFVQSQLEKDLRFFHNPNPNNVKKLYEQIIDRDITESWEWNNYEPARVRKELYGFIKLRGESVHRSADKKDGHLVKKQDVEKCQVLLKEIVNCMDADL